MRTDVAHSWIERLIAEGDQTRAQQSQRFFRTGPGEYGEGDAFLGIRVPRLRLLAREAKGLALDELASLLACPWHEIRLFSLIVLTERAKRLSSDAERAALGAWVFARRSTINNWDLVDVSIPTLFGGWKPSLAWKKRIQALLRSPSIWDRRMAMLTAGGWMRCGDQHSCLSFARALLRDRHDLMHKACGWMLRELGKRDKDALRGFLTKHAHMMPRTMLRYAIERFSSRERQAWMKRKQASVSTRSSDK